jgi:hypothetical protein
MSDERLLLDATFIAGYLNARDQHHSQARAYAGKALMPALRC